MSRLIVKNLPSGMKEDRFRKLFSDFGTLTDCGLKFTKDGQFRKFGFVGFKCDADAERALNHFNRSYIDTSRIAVEHCKAFGDPSKARPWSKHTRPPPQDKPAEENSTHGGGGRDSKGTKSKGPTSVLGELEVDQGFQEFLAVHQKRTQVPTWANDTLGTAPPAGREGQNQRQERQKLKKSGTTDDYLNFDSDESSGQSEEEEEEAGEEEQGLCAEPEAVSPIGGDKEALRGGLSDMAYLRSKVVQKSTLLEEEEDDGDGDDDNDDDEEDEDEEEDDGDGDGEEEEELGAGAQPSDSAYESGDRDSTQTSQQPVALQDKTKPCTEFTVKLRGAPFNVTEQQVREFLLPLKPVAIRIGKNQQGQNSGYVYVDLRSEGDVQKAMKMNKDYLGGRYIEVFRVKMFEEKGMRKGRGQERSFVPELRADEEEEDVAESGRLFIRNLPYTCTEEELSALFSKHGPLAEVSFPIDSLTKKPKGFAFVTYMIPENAVQALAQLDGHVFQGRMLHLLPSRLRKEKVELGSNTPGSSSYKRQKDAKDKAASGSSHNWNSLFLGTSAVADAIADRYSTTKSAVLDHESEGSLAVRMALGETQIVQETRQFLLENGVSLDSFSQAAGPRSTSVLLVKNLPAGVCVADLEALFSPHGTLGRVLLPPAGLTAVVEFLEPTEAKKAFTRLAYSKFQHVPLYLEWAPVQVFSNAAPCRTRAPIAAGLQPVVGAEKEKQKDKADDDDEDEDGEEETVPGATLFIKNLNFSTTEETLHQTFSKCGEIKSCTISRKRDKTGRMLSMGYGFVEFRSKVVAQKALRTLQHCKVDEHQLELKVSERATKSAEVSMRKKQKVRKQMTSKILVRNVPFQATVREVRELFCTFGELKTVRLPRKASGTGAHRGFAFVDFLTKQDAKKAFSALCHSTHLYGRRLVLEWADSEETVDALRRKTAQHFHDAPKKRRPAEMMEGILEQMEAGQEED